MFVVLWLLSAVYCYLPVVCDCLSDAWCLLCVVCCVLCVVHGCVRCSLLLVARDKMTVVSAMLFALCCVLFAVCCLMLTSC